MDDQLRKFISIVEAGTFTHAAELLHISQPALSISVGKLEKSIGAKLFMSVGRQGVVLTETGKLVYAASLEHRRIDENLTMQLAAQAREKVPLRVGMIDGVAALLSARADILREVEALTELKLYVLDSSGLRQAVRKSEIDIAVVVADDKEDDRLEVAAIASDMLLLVCAADDREKIEKAVYEGVQISFLSYTRHSATYAVIERALAREHVPVEPILFSSSPDTIHAMVQQGRCAAVLPEVLIENSLTQGLLVPIRVHGKPIRIKRRLHVVTLKGRKIPPRLAGLAFAMREQLRAYTD